MRSLGLGLGINKLGLLGSKFIAKFGADLSAAYFLADLGSKRGTVDSATNPVSRDRRDSDGGLRAFTAADIKSGTALDYVNNGTSALYGEAMYFDGVDDSVTANTTLLPATGNFSLSITFLPTTVGSAIFGQASSSSSNGRTVVQVSSSGKAFFFSAGLGALTSGNDVNLNALNTLVISRAGTTLSLALNGGTAVSLTSSSAIEQVNSTIGSGYSGFNTTGIVTALSVGSVTWDGSITGATANSWTVNGSPALYFGQPFGSVQAKFYDGLAGANDATQATVADMPKTVVAGARVVDGNGNASTLWDGTDELTFTTAFTGLTAANVYAVTDNAGTVTLDTITDFDISAITTMTALLTSLTYTKVTAVIIAPDNANQAAIQTDLNRLYGI
jgi:hypothetical protein